MVGYFWTQHFTALAFTPLAILPKFGKCICIPIYFPMLYSLPYLVLQAGHSQGKRMSGHYRQAFIDITAMLAVTIREHLGRYITGNGTEWNWK